MGDKRTPDDKTAPPAPDPRPGHNRGYAEPRPRDKDDARQPHPRKKPDPDEGGMERELERKPGAAND